MNKKEAIPAIDFADSKYKSLHMSEDATLTVYLNSWDDKNLKVIFRNTIQFSYKLESPPAQLYELMEENAFLKEARLQYHGFVTSTDLFKHYQFKDIEGFPFLEVVAESAEAFKEDF